MDLLVDLSLSGGGGGFFRIQGTPPLATASVTIIILQTSQATSQMHVPRDPEGREGEKRFLYRPLTETT